MAPTTNWSKQLPFRGLLVLTNWPTLIWPTTWCSVSTKEWSRRCCSWLTWTDRSSRASSRPWGDRQAGLWGQTAVHAARDRRVSGLVVVPEQLPGWAEEASVGLKMGSGDELEEEAAVCGAGGRGWVCGGQAGTVPDEGAFVLLPS